MKFLKTFCVLYPLVLFVSCAKDSRFSSNCEAIQNAKITVAKTSYFAGESISFHTTKIGNARYSWFQSSSQSEISILEDAFITSCEKGDQGWYYLAVSSGDGNCSSKLDSVYITVNNEPVVAPCSPAKNVITFSALSNISTSNAVLSIDPSVNFKKIRIAQGVGYPSMEIFFSQYWNNKEFEDGAYSTQSTLTFDNVYNVQMSVIDQSIYFMANPGKIYLSHVGGKLRVVFCNITLRGTWGSSTYTTTAAADFTLK